jgi:hypothetical protein
MKQYPSISATGHPVALMHVFDKLDGSNLRFEWDQKHGWHKFGTRKLMLDDSHPVFGGAIAQFLNTLAGPLELIARRQAWSNFTAFCEYYGEHSLAGRHNIADIKHLALLDVHIFKRGLLDPRDCLDYFAGLHTPRYLGEYRWDEAFVRAVRQGDLAGVSGEGVVGKSGAGHQRRMRKAKTQAWIDQIGASFSPEEVEAILAS